MIFEDKRAITTVEYLVLAALVLAVVGAAAWGVFNALKDNFDDIKAEL